MNNRFLMIAILIAMAFLIGCSLLGDIGGNPIIAAEDPVTCISWPWYIKVHTDNGSRSDTITLLSTFRVCGSDVAGVTQLSCTETDNPFYDIRCFVQYSSGCFEIVGNDDDHNLLNNYQCHTYDIFVAAERRGGDRPNDMDPPEDDMDPPETDTDPPELET